MDTGFIRSDLQNIVLKLHQSKALLLEILKNFNADWYGCSYVRNCFKTHLRKQAVAFGVLKPYPCSSDM